MAWLAQPHFFASQTARRTSGVARPDPSMNSFDRRKRFSSVGSLMSSSTPLPPTALILSRTSFLPSISAVGIDGPTTASTRSMCPFIRSTSPMGGSPGLRRSSIPPRIIPATSPIPVRLAISARWAAVYASPSGTPRTWARAQAAEMEPAALVPNPCATGSCSSFRTLTSKGRSPRMVRTARSVTGAAAFRPFSQMSTFPVPSTTSTSLTTPRERLSPAPREPQAMTSSSWQTWKRPVTCPGQKALALIGARPPRSACGPRPPCCPPAPSCPWPSPARCGWTRAERP